MIEVVHAVDCTQLLDREYIEWTVTYYLHDINFTGASITLTDMPKQCVIIMHYNDDY